MSSLRAGVWFGLQGAPRSEMRVAADLEYQGYQPLVPTYPSRRRWSDRIKPLAEPLFPGRVFVRTQGGTTGLMCSLPGVVSWLSCAGRPGSVSDFEVVMQRTGCQESKCAYLGHAIRNIVVSPHVTRRTIPAASRSVQAALAVLDEASTEARLSAVDPGPIRFVVGESNVQPRVLIQAHEAHRDRAACLRPSHGFEEPLELGARGHVRRPQALRSRPCLGHEWS